MLRGERAGGGVPPIDEQQSNPPTSAQVQPACQALEQGVPALSAAGHTPGQTWGHTSWYLSALADSSAMAAALSVSAPAAAAVAPGHWLLLNDLNSVQD